METFVILIAAVVLVIGLSLILVNYAFLLEHGAIATVRSKKYVPREFSPSSAAAGAYGMQSHISCFTPEMCYLQIQIENGEVVYVLISRTGFNAIEVDDRVWLGFKRTRIGHAIVPNTIAKFDERHECKYKAYRC